MKPASLLLAASVAVNAGLLLVLLAGATGSSAPAPDAGAPAALSTSTVNETAAKSATWTQLSGGDLRTQRERLVAEGFPPATIRAILAAQIREGFAARRKALDASLADTPFWRATQPSAKTQAELRALAKEEQKALRDLLGPDPENGPGAALHRQFPNLASEKIDQLVAIRERYDEQRQDFYATTRGAYTPDEREKLNGIDKAMHDEFAAVLSPEELENYDLRTSNTANQVRYNLSAFDPTEAEFRAIYRAQKAFDEQFRIMGQMTPEQSRAYTEGRKKMTEEIKAALGETRFADYERATDYNYRQTTQLIARLGLPPETANKVYAVQKEFQQVRTTITSRNQAERDEQLALLASEAQTNLTALLGARGYEAYKQNGGSWLQMLQPPRPPLGN